MGASSAIELAGWPMAGCSVRSGAAQPNGRKRVKAISDRRVFIIKPINCLWSVGTRIDCARCANPSHRPFGRNESVKNQISSEPWRRSSARPQGRGGRSRRREEGMVAGRSERAGPAAWTIAWNCGDA